MLCVEGSQVLSSTIEALFFFSFLHYFNRHYDFICRFKNMEWVQGIRLVVKIIWSASGAHVT